MRKVRVYVCFEVESDGTAVSNAIMNVQSSLFNIGNSGYGTMKYEVLQAELLPEVAPPVAPPHKFNPANPGGLG